MRKMTFSQNGDNTHKSHHKNKRFNKSNINKTKKTSGYATWFTAGGAIRIGHYDVIDDVITQKL